MMKLNLVGGFLGSGKTTATTNAAKLLILQGKKVAVVTNVFGKKMPFSDEINYIFVKQIEEADLLVITIFDKNWKENLPSLVISDVQIMVNSRIETTPEVAQEIVRNGIASISGHGVLIRESQDQAFQPGFPNPTHRISRKLPCCEECRCIKNLNNNQIEACLCESKTDESCCCSF